MFHFFIDKTLKFTKEQENRIKKIARIKNNENVSLAIDNMVYLAKINYKNNNVNYEIIKKLNLQKSLKIDLLQGSLKKDKNEFVVKYGSIAGLKNIIFSNFKRSIKKNYEFEKQIERLNKISLSGSELAKNSYLTNIKFIEKINDFNFSSYDKILLFYEECKTPLLNQIINEISLDGKILIIIGPEGGFDPTEIEFLKEKGANILSLGREILPAELAFLSPVFYLKQHFSK